MNKIAITVITILAVLGTAWILTPTTKERPYVANVEVLSLEPGPGYTATVIPGSKRRPTTIWIDKIED